MREVEGGEVFGPLGWWEELVGWIDGCMLLECTGLWNYVFFLEQKRKWKEKRKEEEKEKKKKKPRKKKQKEEKNKNLPEHPPPSSTTPKSSLSKPSKPPPSESATSPLSRPCINSKTENSPLVQLQQHLD